MKQQINNEQIAGLSTDYLTLSVTEENSLIISGNDDHEKPSALALDAVLNDLDQFNISSLTLKSNWIFIQDVSVQEKIFKTLPPLTSLSITNDYSNEGCKFSDIPKLRYNVSMLKHIPQTVESLYLGSNAIGYTPSELLPTLAKAIPGSVKNLNLNDNALGKTKKPGYIATSMRDLRSIKQLDLGKNQLNLLSIDVLVNILKGLANKSLKKLNLGQNDLHLLDGDKIARLIMAIPKSVTHLNLNGESLVSKDLAIEILINSLKPEDKIKYKAHHLIELFKRYPSQTSLFNAPSVVVPAKKIENMVKIENDEYESLLNYLQTHRSMQLAYNYVLIEQEKKATEQKNESTPKGSYCVCS